MNRRSTVIALSVCLLTAAAYPGAQERARPEIAQVAPEAPAPSNTSQSLVVNGRNFASGLALSITTPSGGTADYRGAAITEQRDTMFRVSVMLTTPGTYRLVVLNPDGQSSAPFALNVRGKADGPVVREVKPIGLRVSTSPQTLTIDGARFDSGLSVTMTDPAGNVQTYTGDAVRNVTPTTFQLILTLETAGRHELIVTNPGGQVSNAVGFDVGR